MFVKIPELDADQPPQRAPSTTTAAPPSDPILPGLAVAGETEFTGRRGQRQWIGHRGTDERAGSRRQRTDAGNAPVTKLADHVGAGDDDLTGREVAPRAIPTPAGVPVKIRSPGYSVQIDDKYDTSVGIVKIS